MQKHSGVGFIYVCILCLRVFYDYVCPSRTFLSNLTKVNSLFYSLGWQASCMSTKQALAICEVRVCFSPL